MAAVLVAMLAALTVLPALLAVLGPRINALRVPLPRRPRASRRRYRGRARRRLGPAGPQRDAPPGALPGRRGRRCCSALALAVPAGSFGGFDERVLPGGTASRVVSERIAAEFPGGDVAPIVVVVSGATPATGAGLRRRVGALPDVTGAAVTASQGRRRR